MADRRSERQQAAADQALLGVAGGLILVLGGVLTLSSLLLADRSTYCAIAGFSLIPAGVLIANRRRQGAWLFIATFAITLAWALRDVSAGGTPLAMRLLGPTLLLGMIALLMPALRGWRKGQTLTAFATLLAGTVGLGVAAVADWPVAAPATALVQLLAD